MNDVARAAGVSQKTVSRVVNGEPHVRADVVARVRAAVEELGFRPNAAARALVTRRSRRIGVISIGGLLHGPAAMLAALEREIREAGYAVALIRTAASTPAEIQAAMDALAAEGVDGIILSEPVDNATITAAGPEGDTEDHGEGAVAAPPGIPLLTVAPGDHDDPAAIQVGVDQSGGARQATAHLLALGHATVAHIAGPQAWAPARQRLHGWRAALLDAGAPVHDPVEGDWSPASGFAAMRELLERRKPTAVFAANDHMAIGALRAITEAGLGVPADVSVVGFDDLPEAEFLSVSLTTVRYDPAEVARHGVRRLIQAIARGAGSPPHLTRTELIVRESTQR
ncbi:LacI family DNA-binding transcriptional regulator [Catenuloplanes japonicus]|uniref:LacI family DNA-binding transcriptional regulator n=1 Tax=Catenuloplanes japonicus TaxID=33876 RepID=UPI000526B073|nr:LacI family DNA-binding transcriptional regulator [Catenuloplanes japonicus]